MIKLAENIVMTKEKFKDFARKHGFEARYSGKENKFYLSKVGKMRFSDLHQIINSRALDSKKPTK